MINARKICIDVAFNNVLACKDIAELFWIWPDPGISFSSFSSYNNWNSWFSKYWYQSWKCLSLGITLYPVLRPQTIMVKKESGGSPQLQSWTQNLESQKICPAIQMELRGTHVNSFQHPHCELIQGKPNTFILYYVYIYKKEIYIRRPPTMIHKIILTLCTWCPEFGASLLGFKIHPILIGRGDFVGTHIVITYKRDSTSLTSPSTPTDSLLDLVDDSLFKEPPIELASYFAKLACLVNENNPRKDYYYYW